MKWRERELRELFDIGLVLKVISGALEFAAAFLILIVPRSFFLNVIYFVTAGELSEDPHDLVANWLRHQANIYAIHAHVFIVAYLLLRGIVKMVLSAFVLRGYMFAYPLFVAALGIFASYEAYRAITTANPLLGIIAVFDTGLMLLTMREYNYRSFTR
jgi:uncharacterized membrane protein